MDSDTPRVAFNLMSARVGGGLTYAISQAEAFLQLWPHDKILLLTSPWNDDAISGALRHPTIMLHARSALERYLKEQTLPARVLRAQRVDVFYGIGNFLPLTPTSRPMIMTLQNPNYVGEGRLLPHNVSFSERARVRLSHLSMHRADLVITISHSLERSLRTDSRLNAVKTRTILSGAPDWSGVRSDVGPSRELDKTPFFLSVANDYPHKRLDDIARALANAASAIPPPITFAFAGNIGEKRRHLLRALAGDFSARMLFLGTMSDRSHVKWLYQHAWAHVSASELEAFPLTPAEAALLNCPLVLSRIAPHLEVTSGAGTFFGKGDIEALAGHLVHLAERGRREPAPDWSWPTTWRDNAGQLADALRGVAG